MSNYTEEDVRQVWLLLDEDVDTLKPNRRPHARARLDVLRAAALEAAKVPGLVADNAALLAIIRRLHYRSGAGCDICDAMDGKRPGAALLAEHEAKVSALQARVEELRREWKRLDEAAITMSRTVDKVMEQRDEARSERDALRAQMGQFEKSIATALGMISEGQHTLAEANLRLALSAPPAETKGRCCEMGRAVACTSCAQHWVCDIHGELHAEATPAPECAEGRNYGDGMTPRVPGPDLRSCNLHADCDTEPGPCCNASDCSDHQ